MGNSKHLSPKQRRSRNREEMTAAIAQTAQEIMREQGVAALNLNEIARRLGMQTPSLYEYFPNKMALYDHLFRVGTRLFRERLAQAMAEDSSPWEKLERALTAYFTCAIEYPELFKLVYERHVPGFIPSENSMTEAYAALEEGSQFFQHFLTTAQIETTLETEQMRDIFLVILHGIIALHLANHPEQPVGQGRFGSLLPAVIEMLKKAWGK